MSSSWSSKLEYPDQQCKSSAAVGTASSRARHLTTRSIEIVNPDAVAARHLPGARLSEDLSMEDFDSEDLAVLSATVADIYPLRW